MPVAVEPRAAPLAAPPCPGGRPFLRAQWCDLVVLSYEVDPAALAPFVPRGTTPDLWCGRTYVSVVGFMFRQPRILGVRVPFHSCFEEVNLRCYVRRRIGDGWRRGVVFIRELVPRRAVAWVARVIHRQNFSAVPMAHTLVRDPYHSGGPPRRLAYTWRTASQEHRLALETPAGATPVLPPPDSLEAFIIDHYWAYAAVGRSTREYCVVHPPWRIAPAQSAEFDADAAALYGPRLAAFLSAPPARAFWADGSPVAVHAAGRLATPR